MAFYLLVKIPFVKIPLHVNQMNVIQTYSFQIIHLGYYVIMVSKGRRFENRLGFFIISVYLRSKIDFFLSLGKYCYSGKGSNIKIQSYWENV